VKRHVSSVGYDSTIRSKFKDVFNPKIRDEILEDASALVEKGFFAHFRRHNRGQLRR
jgi:hypothetical protein